MPASTSIYLFKPRYGDQMVMDTAVMSEKNNQADTVLPNYRFLIRAETGQVLTSATQAGRLRMSQVYQIEATNGDGQSVDQFPGTPLYIKLPWTGSDQDNLTVVFSSDGQSWTDLTADEIVVSQPATSDRDGYVVLRTDHLSYYAVGEKSATTPDTSSGGSSGGGGGGLLILPLMLLGFWSARRKFVK
jgi:hypothetical protein